MKPYAYLEKSLNGIGDAACDHLEALFRLRALGLIGDAAWAELGVSADHLAAWVEDLGRELPDREKLAPPLPVDDDVLAAIAAGQVEDEEGY